MKRCPRCDSPKAVDAFAIDKSKASGRKSICLACDRVKSKAYYARKPERSAAYYQANRERIDARRADLRCRAIAIYGGCCLRCSSTALLEFDHVDDDGGEHRAIEPHWSTIRRIVKTGAPLEDRRLRLLCRDCHRGPGWKQRRSAD